MNNEPLKPNRVKKILREGGVCFGTMLRILDSPHAVSLCAAAGWDYVILDTEHGDFTPSQIASMALVAKYESLGFFVRVPDKAYHLMARTLDVGAEGLVLPRVDTEAEVERILGATKYLPEGDRGASVSALAARYRSVPAQQYLEWANRENMNIIQIESEEAVSAVDALVSHAGIDAVMIGPFDLSQSLGIPSDLSHPRMREAFRTVIEACQKHGVAPGVHLQTVEQVQHWVQEGMRFVTVSYDIQLFREASARLLDPLRQPEASTSGS